MNSAQNKGCKPDILIVDDNPDNLRLLSNILSEHGYKIRRVISGEMALKAVSANNFDLICLDINIPDMSGYEICRKLKSDSQTSKIPIIFISALDETFDKVKAFEVGGVDYISKPFKGQEVISRVENQIKILSLQRELESLNHNLELEVAKRTEELRRANTELKKTQQTLLNKSLIDPVSNLDNKISLMGKLRQLVYKVKTNSDCYFALIVFDCHWQKASDITFNLELDNTIASAIGNRLSDYNTKSSFVAHIEKTEFILVINRANNLEKLKGIAKNFRQKLTEPLYFADRVALTLNYGIALGNENTPDAETILKEARIAARKSAIVDRPSSQTQSIELNPDSLIEFKQAFEQQQLSLLYRPIMALKNGQIQQVKMYLSQPTSDSNVIVSSDLLTAIYEEDSLCTSLFTWIFQTAIADLKKWRERIIWDEKLADINENIKLIFKFSTRQLLIPNIITKFVQTLHHLEISSDMIGVELPEYFITQNPDLFKQICQPNQDLNINWCLDNFSFKYLELDNKYDFALNHCQISSAVMNFEHLSASSNSNLINIIVKMLEIIKEKKMSVTITDIETLEQLKHWRQLGCEFASGNFFTDLISGDRVEDLLVGIKPKMLS